VQIENASPLTHAVMEYLGSAELTKHGTTHSLHYNLLDLFFSTSQKGRNEGTQLVEVHLFYLELHYGNAHFVHPEYLLGVLLQLIEFAAKIVIQAPETQLSQPFVHFVGIATVNNLITLITLISQHTFFRQDFVHYTLTPHKAAGGFDSICLRLHSVEPNK